MITSFNDIKNTYIFSISLLEENKKDTNKFIALSRQVFFFPKML